MIDTTKYEFLTAHFSNNERTIVTSYWGNAGETIEITVKAEEGNENWATLLEHIDIDALHEATYNHIRDQVTLFEDQVINVAKTRGLIYDVDTINSNMFNAVAKIMFKPFDAEKDKEALFMFKLSLFEVPEIKEAKNKELKAKLRKANSIVEALHIACEISLNNS
jgi:hypothetical protein